MFECPVCLSPVAFLPRYQADIIARYRDICDLNDFFFAATTSTRIRARQTALLDRIQMRSSFASSLSPVLEGICCRLLESLARSVRDGLSRAGTTAATAMTSQEVWLLEAKAAIIGRIRSLGGSSDADGCETYFGSLCEHIAACGAISPGTVETLSNILRLRGERAGQELRSELTVWSYERDLWSRCSKCAAFHQCSSCPSCSAPERSVYY
jgi:hypothetical protein